MHMISESLTTRPGSRPQ